MTSGGRGLIVIDATLESNDQLESFIKEAPDAMVIYVSELFRTCSRVLKYAPTTVTELFVWLKRVGGRSMELCPWVIFRPFVDAYRI